MTKTYNFVEMWRDPDSLPEFDREKVRQCCWCGEFHTGDATEMGMEHGICAIPCPFCTIDQLNSYLAKIGGEDE